MPRVIGIEDDGVASLAEVDAALHERGFDPRDEDSLAHAAGLLRRLGNDRTFLGDLVVAELEAAATSEAGEGESYGPQVIMLGNPGRNHFLRANIWPSADEHTVRASGRAPFAFDLPHDHNFNFLTLGYFGPGYWSDYWEYDYDTVAGWTGEPVDLRFVGRRRLEPGAIMLYRAHRDVHRQLPPDALSVSLNIMHTHGAQGWHDQYRFHVDQGEIAAILSPGSSEAFLRIAVGLGGEGALDLAETFASRNPSDRMRLCAWNALASVAPNDAARDRLWQSAEVAGSQLVAKEAAARRAALQA
jgi:hypothetical protein